MATLAFYRGKFPAQRGLKLKKADIKISYHNGTRGEPMLNIKVHRMPGGWTDSTIEKEFSCSPDVAAKAGEFAFESAQEMFFDDIKETAREIFGGHVTICTEGRSGGWLIVSGLYPVESWDAVSVARWAGFARMVQEEIDSLLSWETTQETISANRWAEPGAEQYNFFTTKGGANICLIDLKAAESKARAEFIAKAEAEKLPACGCGFDCSRQAPTSCVPCKGGAA